MREVIRFLFATIAFDIANEDQTIDCDDDNALAVSNRNKVITTGGESKQ